MYAALSNIVWPRAVPLARPVFDPLAIRPASPSPGPTIGGGEVAGGLSRRW